MTTLRALVEEELAHPVLPQVTEMATAIAALYGDAARAVLFYGSCLREARLDGLMLDFYLIVSDYPSAYEKRWLATANRCKATIGIHASTIWILPMPHLQEAFF